MYPKRDAEGFAIDNYSNDVEGAAAFQAHYNGHLLQDDEEDYYEEDSVDEEDDEDYDDCGCSDPCCPCGGMKRGFP